jgi:hypothetical protein
VVWDGCRVAGEWVGRGGGEEGRVSSVEVRRR